MTEQIRLSKRLRAVADFVPQGARLADIGTDHALLPVALLTEGRIVSAVAMDVRSGPLKHAAETVEKADPRVREQVTLRLSDGFRELNALEADCAVIAGMGGELMLRILKARDVKALGISTLVLEPQSEPDKVRAFVYENHWRIADEVMVEEDGKFYPVLFIVTEETQQEEPDSMDLRFGPVLLRKKDAVLCAFLKKEERRIGQALDTVRAGSKGNEDRQRALEQELELVRKALRLTGEDDEM